MSLPTHPLYDRPHHPPLRFRFLRASSDSDTALLCHILNVHSRSAGFVPPPSTVHSSARSASPLSTTTIFSALPPIAVGVGDGGVTTRHPVWVLLIVVPIRCHPSCSPHPPDRPSVKHTNNRFGRPAPIRSSYAYIHRPANQLL